MQIPPTVREGDRVVILATARRISDREIDFARHILEGWGLEVVLAPHLFSKSNQFAGSDSERRTDLQTALDDSSVKAIFCARGGYGTVRILGEINWSRFQEKPKWVIGYSDVTALHQVINKMGIASIHGTMPINFEDNTPESLMLLRQILFGKKEVVLGSQHPLNRDGQGNGSIVGGNLSIIYSLRGTPADIVPEGKILFIEDLDEYLYHIDRMMMNLRYSGILSRFNGLVVGHLTNMHDNDCPFGNNAEEIIADAVKDYDYPVAFGFHAGHDHNNRPLVLGCPVRLEVSGGFTVSYC